MPSPATLFLDDDDDDIVDIDRKEFGLSAKKRKLNDSSPQPTTILLGSTYGGVDPLHYLLQDSGIEPMYWREERLRKEAEARKSFYSRKPTWSKSKTKANANNLAGSTPPSYYLKPERYENLSFSPQDIMTSGLDLNRDPETNRGFWCRVKKGWEASLQRESVRARRRQFAKMG